MDHLIKESWLIYERHSVQEFVVTPSIPILFFGDSRRYWDSEIKVITVGKNPSRAEFPETDRYLRFDRARHVYPRILEGCFYNEYTEALNGYFSNNPYKSWFDSFEPILSGLGASYYGGESITALHTDFCSPLATDPTWRGLSREQKAMLQPGGVALWHRLVEALVPDVIIVSIPRGLLAGINFPRLGEWRTLHRLERDNPYSVELVEVSLGTGKKVSLVFGEAAQVPFGTVKKVDRRTIGERLRRYMSGE